MGLGCTAQDILTSVGQSWKMIMSLIKRAAKIKGIPEKSLKMVWTGQGLVDPDSNNPVWQVSCSVTSKSVDWYATQRLWEKRMQPDYLKLKKKKNTSAVNC